MKTLGIDYGTVRIGLAVSDESQTFARELDILSPADFWQKISDIISENEITTIVIGWPLNMSGEETQKTEEVQAFKEKLQTVVSKLEKPSFTIPSASEESLPQADKGILRSALNGDPNNIKIEIMDERLSSQMAQNMTKGTKNLDSLAAQILLQNYLDRNKKNGTNTIK